MLEKSLWKKLEELNKEIEDFEETDTKKQSQIQSKFHQQLETLNCVFHEIIGKEVELFKSETHHVLLNRYKVLKVRIVFFVLPVNHALFQNLNYNECALHDRNQSYCNPFRTTGFFLYPLKTENLWFFNVFKG